jgi:hypothetical protein
MMDTKIFVGVLIIIVISVVVYLKITATQIASNLLDT